MKKSNKGFTLVELIVVIAIIGILAAILVPAMLGYITDSKLSSANSSAKTVYTAINNYAQKAVNAGYPIPSGDYTGLTVKAPASDANTTKAPTAALTAATAKTAIEDAVAVSMGEDAQGTVFECSINTNGFPNAVIWKKTSVDKYVGGYPTQADDINWTLANAKA